MSTYVYNIPKLPFLMPQNYIYLYHVPNRNGGMGVLIQVPEYADSVTDNLSVQFAQTSPMSRTAPIYSYSYSGPRQVQVAFQLHRDMMMDINNNISNADIPEGEDIVDVFIRYIQAAALPSYNTAQKMVNPPLIAVRLGSDIFIKGVIIGGVGLTYKYPIIPGRNSNGTPNLNESRYSNIDVSFNVAEVDPFDADAVIKSGSYRGLPLTLERKILSSVDTTSAERQAALVNKKAAIKEQQIEPRAPKSSNIGGSAGLGTQTRRDIVK